LTGPFVMKSCRLRFPDDDNSSLKHLFVAMWHVLWLFPFCRTMLCSVRLSVCSSVCHVRVFCRQCWNK